MVYKYVPKIKHTYRPRKKIGYLKNRINNDDIDNTKMCTCNCYNKNVFINFISY